MLEQDIPGGSVVCSDSTLLHTELEIHGLGKTAS